MFLTSENHFLFGDCFAGMPVLIPKAKQSVLLGSAMLGAAASNDFPDLTSAAVAMGGSADAFQPVKELKRYGFIHFEVQFYGKFI